jgi:hypothetical protein
MPIVASNSLRSFDLKVMFVHHLRFATQHPLEFNNTSVLLTLLQLRLFFLLLRKLSYF